MKTAYNFDDFKRACCVKSSKVFIELRAMEGAAEGFDLQTRKQILDFICHDGLKKREFLNSTKWRENPFPKN